MNSLHQQMTDEPFRIKSVLLTRIFVVTGGDGYRENERMSVVRTLKARG